MKRKSWKTAIIVGLTVFLSSTDPFACRVTAADDRAISDTQAEKDDGKGSSNPQANRGTVRSPSTGDGKAVHSGSLGGIHAPSINASNQSPSSNSKLQPSMNSTPTFSRPNMANKTGIVTPPSAANQKVEDSIANSQRKGISENTPRSDQSLEHNTGLQTESRRSDIQQSRIGNQPFVGNTVNLNDRRVNVANSAYQPAYYRHPGYHGYWNGNRGYGGGYGYRPGLGFRIGSGLLGLGLAVNSGYGNGWGWGLGNGYGGGFGNGSSGYRPLGWGLGGWGLGSLIYNSGYLGYSNPYYVGNGSSGYNYSQPIPVSYNSSGRDDGNDSNSTEDLLENADTAFQANDYDAALDIANKGIAQFPDDAVLHEFRSLVLFAKSDYQQSAATIHSVLAIGPGWDWTTLSSMYSNIDLYTKQLRALETFTASNPKDASSRFLLAYHYLSCGHPDAAARCLQKVVKLMPNDRVAADMLKLVSTQQQPIQTGGTPQQSPAEPNNDKIQPTANPIDPSTLVGTWNASRVDGSKFSLTLTNDAMFKWSFTQKDQTAQEFEGTYTVQGNVLSIERKNGGSLIAQITPSGATKFNFRLLDAPNDDPGLDFIR